jgi:hypothetical protein
MPFKCIVLQLKKYLPQFAQLKNQIKCHYIPDIYKMDILLTNVRNFD